MTKPSRKRASKKKMDADTTYMIANMIIPDDTPLAEFNAVYELHNDKLKTTDKAGHAASRDKEATLAGMIVYAFLPTEQSSICKIFYRSASPDALYAQMKDAVRALPSGTVAEEAADQSDISWPSTIGAMALWRKPDDTFWTVFYHHPNVTPRHAAAILKEVVDDFEKDDAAKSGGSNGAKN